MSISYNASCNVVSYKKRGMVNSTECLLGAGLFNHRSNFDKKRWDQDIPKGENRTTKK